MVSTGKPFSQADFFNLKISHYPNIPKEKGHILTTIFFWM
jgi:hypothetical protein